MVWEFPHIDPVALAIGPFEIRWYALAYLAGFLLGWRYVVYLAGRGGAAVTKTDIDDLLPWVILGVILGGRLGYVLFYQFELYLQHPLEILKVWRGGMSFHGGTLGAAAAVAVFSWRRKLPVLQVSDMVCCAAPIGLFFGRIANFINGELFGRPTDVPWGMVFPYGGDVARHPSQLYEAALEGLLLFIVLAVLAHRHKLRSRAGLLSGVFLAGYGAARFFVEFYREPDVQIGYIAGFLTMGQVLCVPMIAAGAGLVFYALRRTADSGKDAA